MGAICCSRRRVLGGLAAGGAAALMGCAGPNLATGRSSFTGFQSIDDDIAMGRESHEALVQAFGGAYGDARLAGYVDAVGRRLAGVAEYQQFPYRFTLLNSPIVNAFALPGGFVYVTRGLLALAASEAELAGVLAHELGHVNARHVAERVGATQIAQLGLMAAAIGAAALGLPGGEVAQVGQSVAAAAIQSYSRDQELEADRLGIRYMSERGYDPAAMVSFLARLHDYGRLEAAMHGLPADSVDRYNIMATHPRTIERVRQAEAEARARPAAGWETGAEAYFGAIDGMLFGDDPEQGMTLGRRFVHPPLRFAFTVPEGFRISNDPQAVIAEGPEGAAILFDLGAIERHREIGAYLVEEWAAGARLQDFERLDVNGIAAATARTQGRTGAGPVDVRLVAYARDGRSAFRMLFVSPPHATRALSQSFQRTTYSFRRLSDAEAASVHPLRLYVRPARADDRIDVLAAALPYDRFNEAWFRVLNGLGSGPLAPGRPIKVIGA